MLMADAQAMFEHPTTWHVEHMEPPAIRAMFRLGAQFPFFHSLLRHRAPNPPHLRGHASSDRVPRMPQRGCWRWRARCSAARNAKPRRCSTSPRRPTQPISFRYIRTMPTDSSGSRKMRKPSRFPAEALTWGVTPLLQGGAGDGCAGAGPAGGGAGGDHRAQGLAQAAGAAAHPLHHPRRLAGHGGRHGPQPLSGGDAAAGAWRS